MASYVSPAYRAIWLPVVFNWQYNGRKENNSAAAEMRFPTWPYLGKTYREDLEKWTNQKKEREKRGGFKPRDTASGY